LFARNPLQIWQGNDGSGFVSTEKIEPKYVGISADYN